MLLAFKQQIVPFQTWPEIRQTIGEEKPFVMWEVLSNEDN
jgi:hypothetical protein